MEAKSLMIEDWVMVDDLPFKVSEISEDYSYSNIKPITITEEILKANGFEIEDYFDNGDFDFKCNGYDFNTLNCIKYQNKNGYQFSINCGEYKSIFIRCLYIHELQHALRLCGLIDLADNFKIN